MFRLTTKPRIAIALLCAALIASRIAGAHLHFCFDGSEALVTLHFPDGGVHHEHAPGGEPHSDHDLPIGGDYLSAKPGKKLGGVDSGLVAMAFSLLLFFLPRVGALIPDYRLPPRPRSARRSGLPPPRGPPRDP